MRSRPKSDIARRTLASLRTSRPNEKGLLVGDVNAFDVAVGPSSIVLVVELIDRLAELLVTGASHPIFERNDRRNTIVKVDGESIRLRITRLARGALG